MTSPRRTTLTLLALPTLALLLGGFLPLGAGAATKHPTISSVLLAARSALLTETSVHVKVLTHSGTTTASVVADIGKSSGRETYLSGDETFTIDVTPTYAYLSGSEDGLINLMDLTVNQQKKVGAQAISMKKGSKPYAAFKSNLTSASFAHLLPGATGTTLLAKRDVTTGGYQISFNEAATTKSPATTTVITIAAGKKALPIKEAVTSSEGKSVTTFSHWGEAVTVKVPSSTVAYATVFPTKKK
jgi:hypothetical protein